MTTGTESSDSLSRLRRKSHPYAIAVANRQSVSAISAAKITRIARATLADESVANARISVALVTNAEMHDVNRRFLKHDFPTDVISFLLECAVATDSTARSSAKSARLPRGTGKRIEGEIIISTEYAVEQAARYGWPRESEITLYLVHGLLHLCGYDDLSAPEKRRMRRREKQILARLGIAAKYARKTGGTGRVAKKQFKRR